MTITKPGPDEYSAHVGNYIKQVKINDLIAALNDSSQKLVSLIEQMPSNKYLFRYAENKWTVQDIVAHLIDCERVMIYRALTIARNDQTPLPGFDEDAYAMETNAEERTMIFLLEEYKHLRKSNILFFQGLTSEMFLRVGTANGKPVSVRALGYSISGHELHHMKVIKERYLS